MAEIVKIVIRSESGYGCIDDAYEDSITVKPTGISYHYTPFLESEMNPSCKWSYKAESAAFREKFQHLASVAEEIIPCEEQVIILDAGATDLIVYYSDKTKKVREYFFEDDRADFFFKMLREMIPSFEKMPVLLDEEDEDDDIVREKIEDAQGIADALLNSPRYDFSNLVPSKLENGLAVVYAIFDKQDDSTLYVGRTKNLRQRLYNNHLMGPKSNARLKKYLTEDPERPDIPTMEAAKQYLIDNCYFQYIPEPDIRQRGQIEGLLGYLLNVRYIHEEH